MILYPAGDRESQVLFLDGFRLRDKHIVSARGAESQILLLFRVDQKSVDACADVSLLLDADNLVSVMPDACVPVELKNDASKIVDLDLDRDLVVQIMEDAGFSLEVAVDAQFVIVVEVCSE